MRRSVLLIVLALLSLSLSAQAQPVPVCSAPAAALSAPGLLAAVPTPVSAPPELVFFTYLPECWMCTWEMPCDTECGWEPGKGGPVTCGEQGAPCGGR